MTAAAAGVPPPPVPAAFDTSRLNLYRYATSDQYADQYLAIMTLMTSTLLAELSPEQIHERLTEAGYELTVDDVAARCRSLEEWGNLIRSVRDAHVATIRDFLRSRARYQASPLGGLAHRHVTELLAVADVARDVARELLGRTAELLDSIHAAVTGPGRPELDRLAADVTTVFSNQRVFRESVADFYLFVQTQMSRYDLDSHEYAASKTMLLDYVDLITGDVGRHAPVIIDRLDRLRPHLPHLVALLDELPSLAAAGAAQRQPGWREEDWAQLTEWYTGSAGRSGPQQLRAAADQALGQLLANTKRLLASAGTGVSRRGDLLRLAGWFNDVDTDQAHRLFNAAFGAYPARHLLYGPDEDSGRDGPTTSWWAANPVDVPITLRERGDRIARGRTARVPDPGLEQAALLQEASQEEADAQAAATELREAGDLHGTTLTRAARELLLDQLGNLLAIHPELAAATTTTDSHLDLALTVTPEPGASTLIHGADGNLTIHDLLVHVSAGTAHADIQTRSREATGTTS